MSAKPDHTQSWYAATANPLPDFPVLRGEVEADVAVVGGGFTGLSAALELAERGFSVALVEGARVGWGASGRNGGLVGAGFAVSPVKVVSLIGEAATRDLFAMTGEALELVKSRIARHAIACDWKPGYLYAAIKPRHLRDLEEECRLWNDWGRKSARMIGRDETQKMVRAEAYIGGMFEPEAGHFHPLNYALGLARAADAAGAKIFEASRAVAAEEIGDGAVVRTAEGSVKAKWLILAGNALLGDLEPRIRPKIMPCWPYIIATERLGQERAAEIIPGDIGVSDINFVLNYYRRSSDHRLLFGGGVSYSGIVRPDLKPALRREMLRWFPRLKDAAIDFCWMGQVDISLNRAPHFGRLGKRTLFAQGFSGHGCALTSLAGKLMAEAVAGQGGRFDLFARIPHASFPGGAALRIPALVLAMTWLRLRDALP